MNALFAKHKWLQIIYGALFLIAGAFIIIIALVSKDTNDLSTWLSIICAIGLFIFGGCSIMAGIFSLEKRYFSALFIYGALSIAIGVVLCTKLDFVIQVIVVFIGVLFITLGAVECGEAAAMIYFKRSKFFIALFFIFAAILITAGVLVLVFQEKELLKKIVYVGAGGILVLIGLIETFRGIRSITLAKKADKEVDDLVKEAEQKSQEDNKEADVVDTQSSEQAN